MAALLLGEPSVLAENPSRSFIQAGDTLEVRASGKTAIEGHYQVISTGEVALPNIEILYVEGIDAADLEALLRDRLSEDGKSAEVSVRILRDEKPAKPAARAETKKPFRAVLPAVSAVSGDEDPFSIHPGDKLNITVADEKLLTGEFLVNASGKIVYPLLGDVDAAGMSVDAFQEALRSQIARSYIKDPRVSVSIVESQSNSVDISGKVAKPGNYVLAPNMTLLRLISQAGGLTSAPSATALQIVRHENGAKRFFDYRFSELVRGSENDPALIRGDIVFVEEVELVRNAEGKLEAEKKNLVSVFGQVSNPGNYRVAKDTTLVTLLGEAGGFTSGAATGRVMLVRKTPTGKKTTTVNGAAAIAGTGPDPLIEDGDVVVVQETFF